MYKIGFYMIVGLLWCFPISLCAMQEVIKVEPFVPYWVGTDTDEYIFIQPSLLHEELNKFCAVGNRNPYALIY